ncbi:DUF262 domain-containing protein [Desulfofustis glycolicus]|uniref:DUF262 domain-containing protein n=1 Tax=Desulfofustis glycolicus DSM 9705 TaxID=1121409 RepID=A0A1M5UJM5_9BACT|nr:DUF262 domain-containing protein [Desulfofustis glycolicus]SHH63244.1 Protein of unknown function [Desulfofustis glycolicus DSM 9705]
MQIDPVYTTVGNLFRHEPRFFIPKYQRAYAWESEPVNDFIRDIKNCFEMRKSNRRHTHFFGGILSVERKLVGTVSRNEYEIIDGQQRIATFTLLVAALIKAYSDLEVTANNADDTENAIIIKGRKTILSNRFVEFEQEVNRQITNVEVLKLSRADQPYYTELIRGANPTDDRESHRRINSAYCVLSSFIKGIVDAEDQLTRKMDNLEIFQIIIDDDCSILHMVTTSRKDAYRLFQVLNDRGTNLTDGDLLRAKTLEILEGHNQEQDTVERSWDRILADHPTDTNNYLNWIYESYTGRRATQNALYDKFCDEFFPQHHSSELLASEAEDVRVAVRQIESDIQECRDLLQGEWPYKRQQPITNWDITRLKTLLFELGHTLSIPLLLAASKLDHRKFAELVQLVERIFFRYKLICNKHVTPLKNIYYQESIAIRRDPANYNIADLKTKLQNLIDSNASDQIFRSELQALEYHETGGSNKPLKYFLMSVEYYYQWYNAGANGSPQCIDKSRVFDFSGTSIEHVYPQNANPADINHTLEPVKNQIGNLTIMDPSQNNIGGSQSFQYKKHIYLGSLAAMTQDIGNKADWTITEIEERRDFLLDAAVAIFRT